MIAIGSDHAAVALKSEIISHLKQRGLTVKDFGTFAEDSVDYTDYALVCAKAVANGECGLGILVCGTGIGMSIAANKVKGIRCAHCCDEFSASMTRQHNDANMLAIGAKITAGELALRIVDVFVDTPFSHDERHKRRIDKITAIEKEYFK